MKRLYVGTALIALVTLMSELIITRVFDVVLVPNMAYMVVTCAMFAFGLSGVFAANKRVPSGERASGRTGPDSNGTNDEVCALAASAAATIRQTHRATRWQRCTMNPWEGKQGYRGPPWESSKLDAMPEFQHSRVSLGTQHDFRERF